jgi:hypothetical protein
MYVIVRSDGKYVAGFGSEHSYTDRLQNAQRFYTWGEAKKHRCPENETIMLLDNAFTHEPR